MQAYGSMPNPYDNTQQYQGPFSHDPYASQQPGNNYQQYPTQPGAYQHQAMQPQPVNIPLSTQIPGVITPNAAVHDEEKEALHAMGNTMLLQIMHFACFINGVVILISAGIFGFHELWVNTGIFGLCGIIMTGAPLVYLFTKKHQTVFVVNWIVAIYALATSITFFMLVMLFYQGIYVVKCEDWLTNPPKWKSDLPDETWTLVDKEDFVDECELLRSIVLGIGIFMILVSMNTMATAFMTYKIKRYIRYNMVSKR